MFSNCKLAIVSAIAFTSARAELKPGKCPVRDQNFSKAEFDARSMAGLWFEYVWDQEFAMEYFYKCSTWIVLSDEESQGPGSYVVYNNLIFPSESEEEGAEDDISYMKFNLKWDAKTDDGQLARASYTRINEDEKEYTMPEANINFIDTDYHSYVVGTQCIEKDGQHEEGYFVWTREKSPSMYMRRRARNALLALGVEPAERMVKG